MAVKKVSGKGKRADPALREAYRDAMQAHSRIRNFKSHGDIHPKVDKHLAKVLEKTYNTPSEWHMPKIVGGSKAKYKAIEGRRVVYMKEGPEIALYKTTGKIFHGIPQHHPNSPIRKYRRVNGVWVRIR